MARRGRTRGQRRRRVRQRRTRVWLPDAGMAPLEPRPCFLAQNPLRRSHRHPFGINNNPVAGAIWAQMPNVFYNLAFEKPNAYAQPYIYIYIYILWETVFIQSTENGRQQSPNTQLHREETTQTRKHSHNTLKIRHNISLSHKKLLHYKAVKTHNLTTQYTNSDKC